MSTYDSTNLKVTDLKEGFIFEYDLSNWEVKAEYEYDWGDNYYTKEFKISDGRNEYFLEIEEDDSVELALYSKVSVNAIGVNLITEIVRNDEPPRTINYKGVNYHRTEESIGYFRNVRNSDWAKFVSWDYEDQNGKQYLTIERWGEEEFEASVGKKINEFEISNILPREQKAPRAPRDEAEKKKTNWFGLIIIVGIIFLIFGFVKCSSNGNKSYTQNPIDELIKENIEQKTFSIILYDMDVKEDGWSNSYLHKYMLILEKDSTPYNTYTDWKEVSQAFFNKHLNDLGMELASKDSTGKVVKGASPAGYNNYIGNEKYGEWKTNSNGQSFWSFYGKYMFLSSVFNMATRPVYHSYYSDYRSNYYGRGTSYYGPNVGGSTYYGTNSNYTKQTRPDFFERKKAKNNFSKNYSRSKTTRSNNRYNGSSSRSRGGGFGK